MKQIYFLSAFFPSFAGGAEKSILEEFKIYARNGFVIKAVSFDIYHEGGNYNFGVVSGLNYPLKYKSLLWYSRLAFLFFNRGLVVKVLNEFLSEISKSDFVILQGPLTPFIARFCWKNKIPYHYYLRDNTSINLFPNYSKGLRKIRKYLKLLIESPFIIGFRIGNALALKRAAKIVVNSGGMSSQLKKRFGLEAGQIIYPKIDSANLTNIHLDPVKQKFITFIGGRDSEKAYEIFVRVAKRMPEHAFLVVEKRLDTAVKGNITYAPAQKDARKIYEQSKIVVSISRWNNEFSGRVGIEAGRLGIPVISSSAIPNEQVDLRKVHVLKNIDDVDEWVEAIRSFEAKRGIFILNSDFGVRNTIGARAHQIWKDLPYKNGVSIFCRDYRQGVVSSSLAKKVVPCGVFIMKLINALHIYLPFTDKFNLNKLKVDIFQFFLIRKLKKMNLKNTNFVHSWDYLPKVYSFLKATSPSIKIIQDVPMAFTSLLEEQLKDKKKEIYDGLTLKVDPYILDCDKYVDAYIAPSQFVKDSLIFEHIDAAKIHVIPFGVDNAKFKPAVPSVIPSEPQGESRDPLTFFPQRSRDSSHRRKAGPRCGGGTSLPWVASVGMTGQMRNFHKEINFCFAGAINKRKGVTYLIEAWKKINPAKARLNLYGRVYPEVSECLKDAEKYNIHVHGFVDVEKELPHNDVYIFPSILEGSAKSVYEAMACGLPVITTHNAGSVAQDGLSGYIVPIADANALVEKIKFFCEHSEKIKEMGAMARKRAGEYSWDRYSGKLREIY